MKTILFLNQKWLSPNCPCRLGSMKSRAWLPIVSNFRFITSKGTIILKQPSRKLGTLWNLSFESVWEILSDNLASNIPSPNLPSWKCPGQFKSYDRIWTSVHQTNQPGLTYMPERGLYSRRLDFNGSVKRSKRWGRNKNKTKEELQIQVLNRFLDEFFRFKNVDTNWEGAMPLSMNLLIRITSLRNFTRCATIWIPDNGRC